METDFVKEFFGDFVTQAIYRELQEISINGVRVERTEGSTAPFLTTFTGFDKRFNDLATAGKLNEIVTGAITASNVVEKVQFAMNELPQKLKWKKGVIRMSKEMAKWYSERYKALHPNATAINNNPTGTITQVDEYQVVIEPWECMFGKNYFVIDMQPDNISNMLVVHHDEVPTMPVLRFEADKRNIAVMGEMYRCYGLRRYEHTFRSKAA
jgi:hypothetical protein